MINVFYCYIDNNEAGRLIGRVVLNFSLSAGFNNIATMYRTLFVLTENLSFADSGNPHLRPSNPPPFLTPTCMPMARLDIGADDAASVLHASSSISAWSPAACLTLAVAARMVGVLLLFEVEFSGSVASSLLTLAPACWWS